MKKVVLVMPDVQRIQLQLLFQTALKRSWLALLDQFDQAREALNFDVVLS